MQYSWGQADVAKYYCQGCCSGVGEYYLKLDSSSEFELYYWTDNPIQDNSVFGIGTYNIKNDILTLTFESIPQDNVESRRINNSDSLIIHFHTIDNIRGDSVALTNIKLKNGKYLFYASATGTIRTKFDRYETINFSSLGFNDITFTLTEPGEYEIIASLNPECKTQLKLGDKKEFKIIRTNKLEQLEAIDDKKLKFTTKSCKR